LFFNWTCVDFKPTYMDFQLNYTFFEKVSINDFKDKLELKIYGIYYFRDEQNNENIEESVS